MSVHDIRLAEMDLKLQVLETASFNGTLIWKIRDYKRRKQEAVASKTLSLYSQPFYTGYFGYKMCARVYLNGDGMGKGTHLSLFFVVMRGEYDALLPWPFKQKVTLMLMDQGPAKKHLGDAFKPDPNSSSFRRPTGEMNIASGCPLFVAQTVLENGTYIKDDTIFIKVTVDTSDLPDPWNELHWVQIISSHTAIPAKTSKRTQDKFGFITVRAVNLCSRDGALFGKQQCLAGLETYCLSEEVWVALPCQPHLKCSEE